MPQRLIASIVFMGALASGTALLSQLSPGVDTPHVLPKQQLPRVFLVEDFLMAAHSLSEEGAEMKAHFLGLIGLKPGSEAESALWKAAARVYVLKFGEEGPIERVIEDTPEKKHVVSYQRLGPSAPPRLSAEEVHLQEIQEAIALADIYRDLIHALEAAGTTIDGIESYMNRDVRKSMSLASSESFGNNHPMWEVARAFEERLAQ